MKLMKREFKSGWSLILAFVFIITLAGCGDNDKVGSNSLISGSNSKTWKADKELTATGEKDKLTDEEKQASMQFYADGRFALGGGGMLQTGTWSFDQTAQRLTLQFEDQEMTENFEVLKLTEDKMELKAADGSVMKMESE